MKSTDLYSFNKITLNCTDTAVIYVSSDIDAHSVEEILGKSPSPVPVNAIGSSPSPVPVNAIGSSPSPVPVDAIGKLPSPVPVKEFTLYQLKISEWDDYLTPWPLEMGKRVFAGKASVLLKELENKLIPQIKNELGPDAKIYIAGYSLAGLFSLWTIYESNLLSGAVSCSGSLWYPGWPEYIKNNKPQNTVKIYLSLGDKEKKTKNKLMQPVEENTLLQKQLLEKCGDVQDICFEFNNGGHFENINKRMAKGISWIV